MKNIFLVCLRFFAHSYCLLVQKTVIEGSRFQDSLLGYWYFEEVDSSDSRTVQYSLKEVQKLHFSKDTLTISNFGDEIIWAIPGVWVCTKGTWTFNSDTLTFSPKYSIGFSTNTGLYYYPDKHGSELVRTLGISFVLKKIDKEKLTVDLIRPTRRQSISVVSGKNPVLEIVSRTYKKAPILKMQ